MATIGIISDTHGHLEPAILTIFKDVDHIVHGGDIGYPSIILELEQVAPVTAVLGNTDVGLDFRETEVATVDGTVILARHIVDPDRWDESLARRIERVRPSLAIFGHTHKAFSEPRGGIHFLNPGYSGRPRHGVRRSVALVETTATGLEVRFVSLDPEE